MSVGRAACRVCYGEEGVLLQPCLCRGSVGWIHEACLNAWVDESSSVMCELCRAYYNAPIRFNRMSPKYKLTYFDIRGLGEPVRYMLSYMGKEFEDNRLQRSEWGPELKKSTIFGKLPTLEIDGKVYSDSRAICRYLAEEAGLAGKTPLENLVIDQTLGAFLDFHGELIRMMKTENPESKEKLKETLLNETCPFYFGKFDKILEENGGYLANGKLTWIDIYIVALTELAPALLGIDLADKYNNFKVLKETVQSLPGIKEWIKKRPAATM